MNEPITLKTLDTASLQSIFDQCARHLLTQNKKSLRPRGSHSQVGMVCAYRGEDSLKCAVGCFISDEEYDPDFEGRVFGRGPFMSYFLSSEKWTLMLSLQIIHDHNAPHKWHSLLWDFAHKNNLITSVLTNEFPV